MKLPSIKLRYLLYAAILGFALYSCEHNPTGLESQPRICFKTDVLPVFTNCTGCHNGGSESEGLDYRTAEGIIKDIVPFQPSSSKIFQVMTGSGLNSIMPPGGPLSKDQRTTIYLWILQGADTACSVK